MALGDYDPFGNLGFGFPVCWGSGAQQAQSLEQMRAQVQAQAMQNAQRGPPQQYDQAQLGNRAAGRQDPAIAAITLEQMQDAYRERREGIRSNFDGRMVSPWIETSHGFHQSCRQGPQPSILDDLAAVKQKAAERMAAGIAGYSWGCTTANWAYPAPPRRHPFRYLLRLPGRFWRALASKRLSRRERREYEDVWGPLDGNWKRYFKRRKWMGAGLDWRVYA